MLIAFPLIQCFTTATSKNPNKKHNPKGIKAVVHTWGSKSSEVHTDQSLEKLRSKNIYLAILGCLFIFF